MQQWEYLYVTVVEQRVIEVNGQEVAKVKKDKYGTIQKFFEAEMIWQFLDRVGSAGWELVSTVIGNEGVYWTRYLFKRPKHSAPNTIRPPQS